MSVLLTSLHVWLIFDTDIELQNTVEVGNFPSEKLKFHLKLPTLGGRGVRLTDLSPAIRCLWLIKVEVHSLSSFDTNCIIDLWILFTYCTKFSREPNKNF